MKYLTSTADPYPTGAAEDAAMSPSPQIGGPFWPNPHQLLLLRAALLPREQSLADWRRWRTEVDIERTHLDSASFRLMPLLFRALSRHGADDPFLLRLRGIYRNRWVRNQLMKQAWLAACQNLHAAELQPLTLGPIALIPRYYQDWGLRPADPVELLVRQAEMAQAADALLAQGWRLSDGRPAYLVPEARQVRASLAFVDEHGQGCILRWGLGGGWAQGEDHVAAWEEALWTASHSVEIEVQGKNFLASTLCPEDELLFLCLRPWDDLPPPPVDWLADAVTILRREGEQLHWPRLLQMAGLSRAGLAAHDILAYLAKEFRVTLPPDIQTELARLPVTPQERKRYDVWRRPVCLPLPALLACGAVTIQQLAARKGARSFVEFARLYYGKERRTQLFTWAVRRILQTASLLRLRFVKP